MLQTSGSRKIVVAKSVQATRDKRPPKMHIPERSLFEFMSDYDSFIVVSAD